MSVQTKPEKTEDVRTCRLELRLSVQERKLIEDKASAHGMTLSDFIRFAALVEEEDEPDKPGPRGEEFSGAVKEAWENPAPAEQLHEQPQGRYRCPRGCGHEALRPIRCNFCRATLEPVTG